MVVTVTVCTDELAPEVAAGDVAAAEDETPMDGILAEDTAPEVVETSDDVETPLDAVIDEAATALELDERLINLPPMTFAF